MAGRDTAHAEGAADFRCLVGGGGEVMVANKTWSGHEYSFVLDAPPFVGLWLGE